MKQRSAFTLIELLIVVAIIAILAAIAVPNFLEAQVRSKVSRTRADMRTVATGLEAYRTDSNAYPPDYTDSRPPRNNPRGITFLGRLSYLTTPIAYLATLPTDQFAVPVAEGAAGPLYASPYRVNGLSTGAIQRPVVFDYAKFDRTIPPLDDPSIWDRFTMSSSSVEWALSSPGPSFEILKFLGNAGLTVYDPSNGTVSAGNVVRTNIGAEDRPLVP
jgi:prepilin-type N-terminal cleavage/methylation domain-containing protein